MVTIQDVAAGGGLDIGFIRRAFGIDDKIPVNSNGDVLLSEAEFHKRVVQSSHHVAYGDTDHTVDIYAELAKPEVVKGMAAGGLKHLLVEMDADPLQPMVEKLYDPNLPADERAKIRQEIKNYVMQDLNFAQGETAEKMAENSVRLIELCVENGIQIHCVDYEAKVRLDNPRLSTLARGINRTDAEALALPDIEAEKLIVTAYQKIVSGKDGELTAQENEIINKLGTLAPEFAGELINTPAADIEKTVKKLLVESNDEMRNDIVQSAKYTLGSELKNQRIDHVADEIFTNLGQLGGRLGASEMELVKAIQEGISAQDYYTLSTKGIAALPETARADVRMLMEGLSDLFMQEVLTERETRDKEFAEKMNGLDGKSGIAIGYKHLDRGTGENEIPDIDAQLKKPCTTVVLVKSEFGASFLTAEKISDAPEYVVDYREGTPKISVSQERFNELQADGRIEVEGDKKRSNEDIMGVPSPKKDGNKR